jgi:hypothetical protein
MSLWTYSQWITIVHREAIITTNWMSVGYLETVVEDGSTVTLTVMLSLYETWISAPSDLLIDVSVFVPIFVMSPSGRRIVIVPKLCALHC